MGQQPDFNLIVKNESTGKWEKHGAAWKRDKGGFSVSIGKKGEESKKYLMVENTPQDDKQKEFYSKMDKRPPVDDISNDLPF